MDLKAGVAAVRVQLEKALQGLEALEQAVSPGGDSQSKNEYPHDPDWFLPNSNNLSPKGVTFINSLFDAGKSRFAISQIMGISYAAVNYRWSKWKMQQ